MIMHFDEKHGFESHKNLTYCFQGTLLWVNNNAKTETDQKPYLKLLYQANIVNVLILGKGDLS